MALRAIPIRRAGNRPNLFMGGDREVVMMAGLVSFALVFSALELIAAIVGIGLWVGVLYLARKAAKSDPQLRFVFQRNFRYKRYYPARSTPFRDNTPSQGRQYR